MLGPLGTCIHHQIGTFVDTVSNLKLEFHELNMQAPTFVTMYCAMKPIDSTCDHTSDFSWKNQHGTKLEQRKINGHNTNKSQGSKGPQSSKDNIPPMQCFKRSNGSRSHVISTEVCQKLSANYRLSTQIWQRKIHKKT